MVGVVALIEDIATSQFRGTDPEWVSSLGALMIWIEVERRGSVSLLDKLTRVGQMGGRDVPKGGREPVPGGGLSFVRAKREVAWVYAGGLRTR